LWRKNNGIAAGFSRIAGSFFILSTKNAAMPFPSFKIHLDLEKTELVLVPGGTFMMGSNDLDAYGDEKVIHSVTLQPFAIGKYPVTQELWEAVMGTNPSYFKGKHRPVEQVSWEDTQ